MALPTRILVFGPSGAGKSTLARRIGGRLGLPAVHLDALFWNPGWVPSDPEPFHQKIEQAVAADAWVMDGNYSQHLALRLGRAQAVIWLDLPRSVYFPRALWRTIRNFGRVRADLGPGCPERIDPSFLFDWVWNYPTHSRAKHAHVMANLPAGVCGITLTTRGEVARFERELPHSLEPALH